MAMRSAAGGVALEADGFAAICAGYLGRIGSTAPKDGIPNLMMNVAHTSMPLFDLFERRQFEQIDKTELFKLCDRLLQSRSLNRS